ncbi:MAG: 50S ribosomal protein L35 [Verrucomicrobiota bacterium]
MSAKTRKSVAKRFKITAKGKVLGSSAGRRHLAASKNRKRMRRLAKTKIMQEADYRHIKENMPFA